jgi:hypothetical protein
VPVPAGPRRHREAAVDGRGRRPGGRRALGTGRWRRLLRRGLRLRLRAGVTGAPELLNPKRIAWRAAIIGILAISALGTGGVSSPGQALSPAPASISEPAIDLHDGMMLRHKKTWYLYGTEYGCGFTWGEYNTPWCGFGVTTAKSPVGPWSAPRLLFSPAATDPYSGLTWNQECGRSGAGCFNARMIQRSGWGVSDGKWILWFNSPSAPRGRHRGWYNVMGCHGPAGPCGNDHKPRLKQCRVRGDFSIVANPAHRNAWIFCSTSGGKTAVLAEQELTKWGTDGTSRGRTNAGIKFAAPGSMTGSGLAHVTTAEGVGAYKAGYESWVMTFSDPQCGYCAGTGTGYATAHFISGPWKSRGIVSQKSCGGQPRTVVSVNDQPYQEIDLWTGSSNETGARLLYEPLIYDPAGRALVHWPGCP